MPGMLNLTNVFEWVIDRFNHGSFAQEKLIHAGHQAVGHVLAALGNQLQSLRIELFKPGLRSIPLIAEQLL